MLLLWPNIFSRSNKRDAEDRLILMLIRLMKHASNREHSHVMNWDENVVQLSCGSLQDAG